LPMLRDPKKRTPENSVLFFRVRAKITSQNWRSDLIQIWLNRKSKTTEIASYFADFASEVSAKDGLKLRCKNVKLFLREPLIEHNGHVMTPNDVNDRHEP